MNHTNHKDHTEKNEQDGHLNHERMFRNKFWISLLLSVPVLVFSPAIQAFLGYSIPVFTGSRWITPLVSIIVFFYGGVPFIKMAIPELRKRQPGMMTLISMAILVAFAYSLVALFIPAGKTFFWELVTLIDIMLLGHWIEMRSVRQASGALDELAKLLPDDAERITEDGEIETVSIDQLMQDDVLLIRPGESIPADGKVIEGQSSVNEAMVTGESKPVEKQPEDEVIAGTNNGDGSLRIKVSAVGEDTALAGIMRLVEDAQSSKSNAQILADRAAGWLFYIAVGVAVITAVAWIIAKGFDVDVVARVATVLVIACPHALGLAVPLVVAITTSLGAKNGILVRDRIALERANKIDVVVFDKTGTLTKGEFGVVDQFTRKDWEANQALAMAAAVEADSEHTIARGIRQSAEERKLEPPNASNFEAIKGRGVRADVGGQTVFVGGPRLLEMLDLELNPSFANFEEDASQKGHSVVHLIVGQQVVTAFALADVIRPESKPTVQQLKDRGYKVAMLTGDSQAVAQSVAQDLGIDTYFAEVLPEHKDQKIVDLQSGNQQVAMIGDGVNDAPALTRADVGIAIGSGTDVAIESAGIILVQNNPLDVVKIFALSQATRRKMIQNLFWAAGYNVLALPLAAGILAPFGILLSPAVGALLMSINAQLLRNIDLNG